MELNAKGVYKRIALFGGIYNNYLSLIETIRDAKKREAEEIFFLGDIGGFGPNPNKSIEILLQNDIKCIQGNYDDSVGNNKEDCGCGYTDPRDNYYAQISYDYTFRNTSSRYKGWMRTLPQQRRIKLGKYDLLLCHGSPRKVNEFLWYSTSPVAFLKRLIKECGADIVACTHTGIHWYRKLSNDRHFINVGVIGRPANDGRTNVWYTMVEADEGGPRCEFIPVYYDYRALAMEMKREDIPKEFIETILTGWWTTCLEILPAKERMAGKF